MEQRRRVGRPRGAKPWTFRDWYEKNKKSLAERRKKRYLTDETYRQGIIERNKEYRKQIKNVDIAVRVRKPKQIPINVNGVVEAAVVFNIGYLAYRVGKSPATVRGWEKNGLLPRTPFTVGGKSERVYTDAMVNAVKHAVESRGGHIAKGDELFYREILTRWQALGIKVDNA